MICKICNKEYKSRIKSDKCKFCRGIYRYGSYYDVDGELKLTEKAKIKLSTHKNLH